MLHSIEMKTDEIRAATEAKQKELEELKAARLQREVNTITHCYFQNV